MSPVFRSPFAPAPPGPNFFAGQRNSARSSSNWLAGLPAPASDSGGSARASLARCTDVP
jgi:hypothetical protein